MQASETPKDPLSSSTLGAKDLRNVAGLSYRQLNEWDKRDALPSQPRAEGGWRKVNGSQAMALRITSELKSGFGIPLVKLRPLVHWLLGELPTPEQSRRLLKAEDYLFAFTEDEKDSHNELIRKGLTAATDAGGGILLVPLRIGPAPVESEPVPVEQNTGASLPADADFATAMVKTVLPRLLARGWPQDNAVHFATAFFGLSVGKRFGTASLPLVQQLIVAAHAASDASAARAASFLGCALVPLYEALKLMGGGFPVLLLTDLRSANLLEEPTYLEWVRLGMIPPTAITIRVNEHINAVLEQVGGKVIPVTQYTAEIEPAVESQILDLLRRRDFDRLVVEPKEDGFRLELQRDLSDKDERNILRALKEHDYQSITVKTRAGKIVRLTQSISLMAPNPRTTGRPRPEG